MTFSINQGENTESNAYQLTGDTGTGSSFEFILKTLEDNEIGNINPIDIRTAVLSSCSSNVLKITNITSSNTSYIGIDTLNPDNNDLKGKKILLGKRGFQNNDLIKDELLESDNDIIFWNTKSDNQQQITTKISLLSGTDKDKFTIAPFIQSQSIFATQSLSFDFISQNGDVNMISGSGSLNINGLKLPNGESASNNRVLTWNSSQNSIVFDSISSNLGSEIGTQSETLEIFGKPTNLNGYSLEFSDNRRCPIEIGDLKLGETFEDFSISEILKRIVYKYLPPFSRLRLISHPDGYAEVGTFPSVVLEYSIFKRTRNTEVALLLNMIPGSSPAIQTPFYSSITGTASGLVPSFLGTTGVTFSVTVGDGQETTVTSTNIRGIFPYYYGFSTKESISNNDLLGLTKLVEDKSDKSIIIQPDSGFFYFLYDSDYGVLGTVSNSSISSLTHSNSTLSSPNGFWTNKEFKIYKLGLSTNTQIILEFKY